jgi:hypothetical protein
MQEKTLESYDRIGNWGSAVILVLLGGLFAYGYLEHFL